LGVCAIETGASADRASVAQIAMAAGMQALGTPRDGGLFGMSIDEPLVIDNGTTRRPAPLGRRPRILTDDPCSAS
jgi:hypothetical protein